MNDTSDDIICRENGAIYEITITIINVNTTFGREFIITTSFQRDSNTSGKGLHPRMIGSPILIHPNSSISTTIITWLLELLDPDTIMMTPKH